jgi:hypothetical protein
MIKSFRKRIGPVELIIQITKSSMLGKAGNTSYKELRVCLTFTRLKYGRNI